MSDTAVNNGRDQQTGQFLKGYKGGGRKPGSRNKLGEQFLADLADAWQQHGTEALRRCFEEEPATFCKIVAGLLPKEAELSVSVDVLHDVTSAVQAFRTLSDALGTEPKLSQRQMRQITARISGDVFEG